MRGNSLVLMAACLAFAVSFWKRNDLPADLVVHPAVDAEPRQLATERPAFSALWHGVDYRVEPQFEYELYGVVVSFRQHDGSSRMHRLANDHLNVADLCVVWGDNARSDYLPQFEFWNGIFTCNVRTSDRQAWESFHLHQMSNNHLISDDPQIRERVNGIRPGDQVHIRGVLASYGSGRNERGTSTTRTDTGDGACETIYVEQFEVIAATVAHWRWSMYVSLAVIAMALVRYFRKPYRPYEN